MSEIIRIGSKSKGRYLSAIVHAFKHGHESVTISGLGTRVSKSFDIADQAVNSIEEIENANTETFEKDGKIGVKIKLKNSNGGGGFEG